MKFPTIFGLTTERVSIYNRMGIIIAKLIKNTGITPNQITIFRQILFLFIFYCLYIADYKHYLIAGVLLEINMTLDYVDGNLARLKNMESKFGEWMEKVLDSNLSENFNLFGFFLALGIYRVEQNNLIWIALFFNIFGSCANKMLIEKYNNLVKIKDNFIIDENKTKKGLSRLVLVFIIWYNQFIIILLFIYKPIYSLLGINPLFWSLVLIAVIRLMQSFNRAVKTLVFFKKNNYF